MDFVLSTDLARAVPQEINFNFDEIKAYLTEKLVDYSNLVVTEDGIQAAKKDRAALNRLKDAIEDKRKSVKKACLSPYEGFEGKVKELVGMIQDPINAIDVQVKTFDERRKREKYDAITAFYSAHIGELRGLLAIERIIPEKWANSGMTLDTVTKEIEASIEKAKNDIQVIREMRLTCETSVLDVYLRTLDMGHALAEKNRLEAQQAALARHIGQAAPMPIVADGSNVPLVPENERETAFSGCSESAPGNLPAAPDANLAESIKTIKVAFFDTTEAFRREMKALTEKYGIKYRGIA